MTYRIALLAAPMFFVACGGTTLGGVGDPCETTADCEEGLECHLHDGEMECEEPHDDDDNGHDHGDNGHDNGDDGHDHGDHGDHGHD